MRKFIIGLSLISFLISGCFGGPSVTFVPRERTLVSLEHLQSLEGTQPSIHDKPQASSLRYTAMEDTALTVAAQAGLAHRAAQINAILTAKDRKLSQAYNFYGMLLEHNIIPPVLVEGNNTLNLAAPDTIRLSQKVFRIEVQAHFVTAPPTWRDYLWMDYTVPELPNNTLLPRTKQEKIIWDYYIHVGWQNGVDQANSIFWANLSRLNRDYKGMILYRKLYAQNMVSAPFVSKTELGITGDNAEMNINDRVLRITALPQLNLQGNTWRPILVPTDFATQEQMRSELENSIKYGSGQG